MKESPPTSVANDELRWVAQYYLSNRENKGERGGKGEGKKGGERGR